MIAEEFSLVQLNFIRESLVPTAGKQPRFLSPGA